MRFPAETSFVFFTALPFIYLVFVFLQMKLKIGSAKIIDST